MGTPVSATAAAVPPAGPLGGQLPEPVAPPAPAGAPTFATSGQTPVFDAGHAPAADIAPPPPPAHAPIDTSTSYLAGPSATMSPQAVAPPAGPLPAYGADIRPPVAVAPAPPTAPAGHVASPPSSAPVSPAAGGAGVGQPAVVRQPSSQPTSTPAPTPAGIGEQALVASGGGAAAGVASAASTARARLQRLIEAVARQEPRLAWAAGDRSDGTSILVTDLASGWIPPGIDIPTGLQLHAPAPRRGDLEALLGEVNAAASYAPLHYLPPEDKEPVPTSPRARQGPVVEDLGWELGQATKWRDGLPRLAHTLAGAASRGTGVDEKEIELLQQSLTTSATKCSPPTQAASRPPK